MGEWISVVSGLGGVLVGAWFARARMREEHRERLRAGAYADYLRGVSARAFGDAASLQLVTEAKARIVIHGPAAVVKALARLEREGSALATQSGIDAFVKIARAMRRSARGITRHPSSQDIRDVLFGPERDSAN